jgi:hypothetical protein
MGIEERAGYSPECVMSMDLSVMSISLEDRAYNASNAEPITTEATDWRVVATIGLVLLVTVAWNGLLLWFIWQLF